MLLAPLQFTAAQTEEDFLADFIAGKYRLLGKPADSDESYLGLLELKSGRNGIEVTRLINGEVIVGIASLETATADEIPVLRMRFQKNNQAYEETCLLASDLDNYPRITCHLYRPGIDTGDPGLEALFFIHSD